MMRVPLCAIQGLWLVMVGVGLSWDAGQSRAQQPTNVWKASGKNGAVAAGGQAAADAGIEMLKAGGTAADAAAATTLVMTILEYPIVCIGGEIPILFYDAKRQTV